MATQLKKHQHVSKDNLEPSAAPVKTAAETQMDTMQKQMLQMMQTIENNNKQHAVEMATLQGATPQTADEALSDMAKRKEECSASMLLLINDMKERIWHCYGSDPTKAEIKRKELDPNYQRYRHTEVDGMVKDIAKADIDAGQAADAHLDHHELIQASSLFTRPVVEQCMWTLANTAGKQYCWARRNGDRTRLRMFKLGEQSNHYRNRQQNSDGVGTTSDYLGGANKGYEIGMNPNKDYERAEEQCDIHAQNELSYEVLYWASVEIWQELIDERVEEYEASNGVGRLAPINEPSFRATDAFYTSYLDKEVNDRERQTLLKEESRMETSRLAHYANIMRAKTE
jgi:hypothetical protein